jgi:uncharacterized protein (DUF2141 family)
MHAMRLSPQSLTASLLSLLVFPAWATAPSPAGGDITVAVSTVRNRNGQIICALFDTAAGFEKRVPLARVIARPEVPSTTCMFHTVKAGIYAITAIHDENDNGRLDKTFFGRPTEEYGISKNHTYAMHGPRFSESSFSFPGTGDVSVAVHLRYP